MTDKDKFLIELFDKYHDILEHCNKPCKNMYSKDEFWTRHNVFKELQKEMRSYSFMIFMQNLKQKIRNFFNKFKRKRKPVECIVAFEPTVPAKQTEPTTQIDSIGPADLTTQIDSTSSADLTTQIDSTGPTDQTTQIDPTEPKAPQIKKRRGRKRKIV